MTEFTNQDLELYVMGGFDGDVSGIEEYIAADPAAQAYVAEQAKLELFMRQVGQKATFCRSCDDVVAGDRCEQCGAALRAGGYTVAEVLVETAHGRLYVARDADGQRVALKELAFVQAPDAAALAAFEREAKFLRALQHPAIPRFVSSFREGEGVHTRLYLAQEFIDGEGLDKRLANHFFTEDEISEIAREVLDVLVYLQSVSPIVVHRDIKPANLIRRQDGTIAVVDFGAALDQGQTQGATTIGTFGYMPIEQMAGIVDSTTDGYALGASLWHLLTRREPWKMLGSSAMETANVSDAMAAYLNKLTAQQASDRYPSAHLARQALDQLRTDPQALVVADKKSKPARHRERRGRRFFGWPLAATAVSIVALGVGGSIALTAIEADREIALAGRDVPVRGNQWVAEESGDSTDHATLVIETNPPGAAVFLNGKEIGKTPLRKHVPANGEPQPLAFRRAGYEETMVVVRLEPGQTFVRRIDLNAAHAKAPTSATQDRFITGRIPPIGLPSSLPVPKQSIDFAFKGDLPDALKRLAKLGNLNLIVPDYVQGQVDVDLKGVLWTDVMEALLKERKLWYEYTPRGRIIRVAPANELD